MTGIGLIFGLIVLSVFIGLVTRKGAREIVRHEPPVHVDGFRPAHPYDQDTPVIGCPPDETLGSMLARGHAVEMLPFALQMREGRDPASIVDEAAMANLAAWRRIHAMDGHPSKKQAL